MHFFPLFHDALSLVAMTFIQRVTYLTYIILVVSIILACLSIATIILQLKVNGVFQDLQVQIPGSNIAEWMYVSLNPVYLDTGPGISILVVGACGIMSGLSGMSWVITAWVGWDRLKTRMLGLIGCLLFVINTGVMVALMTYVLVTQAGMELPERFQLWGTTTFTQEYYVCTAFPSLIVHAEARYYGFPACDAARSARYMLIGIAIASVFLTILAAWEAGNSGAVAMLMHTDQDVEKVISRTPSPMPTQIPSNLYIPEMVRGPRETRQPIDHMPLMAHASNYEYLLDRAPSMTIRQIGKYQCG
ncbi:hypothetical protein K504DRAFT_45145 [Pleomassaria siparia CBS 279.74]|uniref:Uncharacterized protein n=1 Tax=Pleomassaria siparia CBS 279.74 TaxID=1314801 RepID=A0A6G1K5N7_9PLEO|nr:hypothetical protein K504DRAFT_45145 [Pleomassaria siparia CBS 279.74]